MSSPFLHPVSGNLSADEVGDSSDHPSMSAHGQDDSGTENPSLVEEEDTEDTFPQEGSMDPPLGGINIDASRSTTQDVSTMSATNASTSGDGSRKDLWVFAPGQYVVRRDSSDASPMPQASTDLWSISKEPQINISEESDQLCGESAQSHAAVEDTSGTPTDVDSLERPGTGCNDVLPSAVDIVKIEDEEEQNEMDGTCATSEEQQIPWPAVGSTFPAPWTHPSQLTNCFGNTVVGGNVFESGDSPAAGSILKSVRDSFFLEMVESGVKLAKSSLQDPRGAIGVDEKSLSGSSPDLLPPEYLLGWRPKSKCTVSACEIILPNYWKLFRHWMEFHTPRYRYLVCELCAHRFSSARRHVVKTGYIKRFSDLVRHMKQVHFAVIQDGFCKEIFQAVHYEILPNSSYITTDFSKSVPECISESDQVSPLHGPLQQTDQQEPIDVEEVMEASSSGNSIPATDDQVLNDTTDTISIHDRVRRIPMKELGSFSQGECSSPQLDEEEQILLYSSEELLDAKTRVKIYEAHKNYTSDSIGIDPALIAVHSQSKLSNHDVFPVQYAQLLSDENVGGVCPSDSCSFVASSCRGLHNHWVLVHCPISLYMLCRFCLKNGICSKTKMYGEFHKHVRLHYPSWKTSCVHDSVCRMILQNNPEFVSPVLPELELDKECKTPQTKQPSPSVVRDATKRTHVNEVTNRKRVKIACDTLPQVTNVPATVEAYSSQELRDVNNRRRIAKETWKKPSEAIGIDPTLLKLSEPLIDSDIFPEAYLNHLSARSPTLCPSVDCSMKSNHSKIRVHWMEVHCPVSLFLLCRLCVWNREGHSFYTKRVSAFMTHLNKTHPSWKTELSLSDSGFSEEMVDDFLLLPNPAFQAPVLPLNISKESSKESERLTGKSVTSSKVAISDPAELDKGSLGMRSARKRRESTPDIILPSKKRCVEVDVGKQTEHKNSKVDKITATLSDRIEKLRFRRAGEVRSRLRICREGVLDPECAVGMDTTIVGTNLETGDVFPDNFSKRLGRQNACPSLRCPFKSQKAKDIRQHWMDIHRPISLHLKCMICLKEDAQFSTLHVNDFKKHLDVVHSPWKSKYTLCEFGYPEELVFFDFVVNPSYQEPVASSEEETMSCDVEDVDEIIGIPRLKTAEGRIHLVRCTANNSDGGIGIDTTLWPTRIAFKVTDFLPRKFLRHVKESGCPSADCSFKKPVDHLHTHWMRVHCPVVLFMKCRSCEQEGSSPVFKHSCYKTFRHHLDTVHPSWKKLCKSAEAMIRYSLLANDAFKVPHLPSEKKDVSNWVDLEKFRSLVSPNAKILSRKNFPVSVGPTRIGARPLKVAPKLTLRRASSITESRVCEDARTRPCRVCIEPLSSKQLQYINLAGTLKCRRIEENKSNAKEVAVRLLTRSSRLDVTSSVKKANTGIIPKSKPHSVANGLQIGNPRVSLTRLRTRSADPVLGLVSECTSKIPSIQLTRSRSGMEATSIMLPKTGPTIGAGAKTSEYLLTRSRRSLGATKSDIPLTRSQKVSGAIQNKTKSKAGKESTDKEIPETSLIVGLNVLLNNRENSPIQDQNPSDKLGKMGNEKCSNVNCTNFQEMYSRRMTVLGQELGSLRYELTKAQNFLTLAHQERDKAINDRDKALKLCESLTETITKLKKVTPSRAVQSLEQGSKVEDNSEMFESEETPEPRSTVKNKVPIKRRKGRRRRKGAKKQTAVKVTSKDVLKDIAEMQEKSDTEETLGESSVAVGSNNAIGDEEEITEQRNPVENKTPIKRRQSGRMQKGAKKQPAFTGSRKDVIKDSTKLQEQSDVKDTPVKRSVAVDSHLSNGDQEEITEQTEAVENKTPVKRRQSGRIQKGAEKQLAVTVCRKDVIKDSTKLQEQSDVGDTPVKGSVAVDSLLSNGDQEEITSHSEAVENKNQVKRRQSGRIRKGAEKQPAFTVSRKDVIKDSAKLQAQSDVEDTPVKGSVAVDSHHANGDEEEITGHSEAVESKTPVKRRQSGRIRKGAKKQPAVTVSRKDVIKDSTKLQEQSDVEDTPEEVSVAADSHHASGDQEEITGQCKTVENKTSFKKHKGSRRRKGAKKQTAAKVSRNDVIKDRAELQEQPDVENTPVAVDCNCLNGDEEAITRQTNSFENIIPVKRQTAVKVSRKAIIKDSTELQEQPTVKDTPEKCLVAAFSNIADGDETESLTETTNTLEKVVPTSPVLISQQCSTADDISCEHSIKDTRKLQEHLSLEETAAEKNLVTEGFTAVDAQTDDDLARDGEAGICKDASGGGLNEIEEFCDTPLMDERTDTPLMDEKTEAYDCETSSGLDNGNETHNMKKAQTKIVERFVVESRTEALDSDSAAKDYDLLEEAIRNTAKQNDSCMEQNSKNTSEVHVSSVNNPMNSISVNAEQFEKNSAQMDSDQEKNFSSEVFANRQNEVTRSSGLVSHGSDSESHRFSQCASPEEGYMPGSVSQSAEYHAPLGGHAGLNENDCPPLHGGDNFPPQSDRSFSASAYGHRDPIAAMESAGPWQDPGSTSRNFPPDDANNVSTPGRETHEYRTTYEQDLEGFRMRENIGSSPFATVEWGRMRAPVPNFHDPARRSYMASGSGCHVYGQDSYQHVPEWRHSSVTSPREQTFAPVPRWSGHPRGHYPHYGRLPRDQYFHRPLHGFPRTPYHGNGDTLERLPQAPYEQSRRPDPDSRAYNPTATQTITDSLEMINWNG